MGASNEGSRCNPCRSLVRLSCLYWGSSLVVAKPERLMSNSVRQQDPSSVVADNIWVVRPGVSSLLLSVVSGTLVGLYLGRRDQASGGASCPGGWPVNIAHCSARLGPENTLVSFEESLEAGPEDLELGAHITADGCFAVMMHDDRVDRTTDGVGLVRTMALREVKKLDAGYRFFKSDRGDIPLSGPGNYRSNFGRGVSGVPGRPGQRLDKGGPYGHRGGGLAGDRGDSGRRAVRSWSPNKRPLSGSSRRYATAGGDGVFARRDSHLRPPELLAADPVVAAGLPSSKGPKGYRGFLHIVTSGFVCVSHKLGTRLGVWPIDSKPDMAPPTLVRGGREGP